MAFDEYQLMAIDMHTDDEPAEVLRNLAEAMGG
jgi:hypothetical protein